MDDLLEYMHVQERSGSDEIHKRYYAQHLVPMIIESLRQNSILATCGADGRWHDDDDDDDDNAKTTTTTIDDNDDDRR